MRRVIIFLMLLLGGEQLGLAAQGQFYSRIVYSFNQKKVTFLESRTPTFTITEACFKQGRFECLAWDAVLSARPIESIDPDDLVGGAEPGAVLCAKHFGGTPVFGKSPSGGTRSFCLFKDRSLAASGSLLKKTAADSTH